jgi:3-oxoacyl-[acyl-carrier protein] reductase
MIIGSCVGERNKTPGPDAYELTNNAMQMFAQGLARYVETHCTTANNVHPRQSVQASTRLRAMGQ